MMNAKPFQGKTIFIGQQKTPVLTLFTEAKLCCKGHQPICFIA